MKELPDVCSFKLSFPVSDAKLRRKLLYEYDVVHIDVGHFDNSDWHDRLARAKRDVSWRPGDLTWSVLGLSGNIVTIVLMSAGAWLVITLAEIQKNQDCYLSGRRNCMPIPHETQRG